MSKENPEIMHFAVALKDGFESKLGTNPYIVQHNTIFAVPTYYGTVATAWRLKEEFRTYEGKEKLVQEIKKDIRKFNGQDDSVSCTSMTIITFAIGWIVYCCTYVLQT
jgi:hypothetical protein